MAAAPLSSEKLRFWRSILKHVPTWLLLEELDVRDGHEFRYSTAGGNPYISAFDMDFQTDTEEQKDEASARS